MNKMIKSITINSILIALTAIMTFVPYIGYITIGGTLSFTTLHIIVIFAAAFFGFKEGIVTSFAFGLFCLIKAASMPGSPADADFVNPLISILPRVLFGLASSTAFYFVRKSSNSAFKYVMLFLLPPLLTIFHSFITLSFYYLITVTLEHKYTNDYLVLISSIFTINGVIEIISSLILVPTLVLVLNKALPNMSNYKIETNQKGDIDYENK